MSADSVAPADAAVSPGAGNPSVLAVAAGLMALGVVMSFSTVADLDPYRSDRPIWSSPALRQVGFTIVGLVVALLVSRVDYRRWIGRADARFPTAVVLYALALAMLAAVLFVGVEKKGAQRWIQVGAGPGGIGLQPSELCKPAIVLFLARLLWLRRERMHSFVHGFLPCAAALAACVTLIGIEDFGTALLIAAVGGGMLWVGRARPLHLFIAALPAVAGFVALVLARPFRLKRLIAFLNIWDDPQNHGYHAVQSLVTIASGGWTGRGLGAGVQKYGYLPESRTDFVFPVICEELGVIGGLAVIGLFIALVWQGRRTVARAPDDAGRLLALGATLMIGLQALLNLGVVTASLPTKGIGLPFVSAGGSSALFLGFLTGMLAGVPQRPADYPMLTATPSPAGTDGPERQPLAAGYDAG